MTIERDSKIKSLTEVDVLVIGGGATGLGIAVDSTTRGYKTLLLEKNDYAKATSSRSTKILHGGVRYLAQGNISLVKEALAEKMRLYENAPHVARSMNFIVPSTNTLSKMYYRIGMLAYDALAGFHRKYLSRGQSHKEMITTLKNIKYMYLRGGVLYNDGQFDDARTAIALLRTLEDNGGTALNYAEVISFIKEKEKIVGAVFLDKISGNKISVRAKCVFNATGIYSDTLMDLDATNHQPMVNLAQGIHLVVNRHVYPNKAAMLVPKTTDGRVLFFIPWYNKVIIGTTDVHVNKVQDDPTPLQKEINLIIKNANLYLEEPLTKEDISAVYAGIRPLMQVPQDKTSTAKISREDHIDISRSGLITIVGGKWTTYRHMGEKVINFAIAHNKLANKSCKTRNLKLHGYVSAIEAADIPFNYRFYGSEYETIKEMPNFHKVLHDDLPICEAQILYAIKYEQALTLDDVLARRTRCLFLNAEATLSIVEKVADIMQKALQQTKQWKEQQIKDFTTIAKKYLISSYI